MLQRLSAGETKGILAVKLPDGEVVSDRRQIAEALNEHVQRVFDEKDIDEDKCRKLLADAAGKVHSEGNVWVPT